MKIKAVEKFVKNFRCQCGGWGYFDIVALTGPVSALESVCIKCRICRKAYSITKLRPKEIRECV
jgi:hypothetical protein